MTYDLEGLGAVARQKEKRKRTVGLVLYDDSTLPIVEKNVGWREYNEI